MSAAMVATSTSASFPAGGAVFSAAPRIALPAPIIMPVPMQQGQLFQAAEAEQRRQAAMQHLSEQMSAQQSRLEPPLLGGFPYSILQLNAAMRNQALRERALAEAAALEAKNVELREEAEGKIRIEAAEKKAAEEAAWEAGRSALREPAEGAQRQAREAAEEAQRQAEEAQRQADEEAERSRRAAAEALERPEALELAALPGRIAEARFYKVDAEKVAEAERIYKERAVAAFHLEQAQERLLRAVSQGRADNGALPRAPSSVVRRVLPLPLPTLLTTSTHTIPLVLEGKTLSEPGTADLLEEEERSTAASEDQPAEAA